MRLHQLTVQAFGPYPVRQQVDFDELAGSGLFLLEGPTGAGKSSVLDAITFALYGELAGSDAGKDRLHSDFADPGLTPEVCLEWSVRGRRFRVTRSPEHDRPRKRGDGTTRQAAQVHLEQLVEDGWESISSNKAEVGAYVTDLLGLSRAQFTQVVLLPQNEFAQFLRAGDDERRALLTRLFGVDLYDRITAELDRRRHDAEAARRAAADHTAQAIAAAAQAARTGAEREDLVALEPAELETRFAELAAQFAAADEAARVAADQAQRQVELARREQEAAAAHADRVHRAVDATTALAALERSRPDHDARADRLERARRAEPVRPLLAALRSAQAGLAVAVRALADLAPDADADMRRGVGAADQAQRAAAATQEAARLAAIAELETGLPARRAELAALQASHEATTTRLTDLAQRLAALPARRSALEEQLHAATRTGQELPVLTEQLRVARERHVAAAAAAALAPQIAARRAEWAAATQRASAAADTLRMLVDERIAGMSAELAAGLAPGEPCPVCGAREHPAPARPAGQPVTDDDLAAAQAAREQAERDDHDLGSALTELIREHSELVGRAGDGTPEALRTEQEQLAARLAAVQSAAARATAVTAELESLRQEQERLQEEDRSVSAERARLAERVAATTEQLGCDDDTVAAERGSHPSVAARIDDLTVRAAHHHGLAAALTQVATALAARDTAAARAAAEASAQGFPDAVSAQAAVLGAPELEALAEEVAEWERRHRSVTDALAAPDLAGLDVTDAALSRERLAQARERCAAAEAAHADAAARQHIADKRAKQWSQCVADVRRAQAAHARTVRETAAVVRLAALAKGTHGQRKVALTTYVLRHWFAQVVAAANVRLAAMSAGRYELERTDEAASRAKRGGLGMRVVDRYTGERRDPRSLSGGETFFTSLALALGLAEVVSAEAGGVDLDTLFIDEGFGSLDGDTLEQVMAVIDELRDHGRVVGIVSHVPDLKERVPERLEVRRVADGSSRLRVVA